MNGLDIFKTVFEHLKRIDPYWNLAVDSIPTDSIEVPEGCEINISGAVLKWNETIHSYFKDGFQETNFDYQILNKVSCSSSITNKIDLIDANTGSHIGMIYPNCIDWIGDPNSFEFFIRNLDKLILPEDVGLNIDLSLIIQKLPFVCYNPQYREDVEYSVLKLGYNNQVQSTNQWFTGPTTSGTTVVISHIVQTELLGYFRSAMITQDLFHQYIELYHIIEYKFYEGLYTELTRLRLQSAKKFYDKVIKSKKVSELDMFTQVFKYLADGFTERLDTASITTNYQQLLNDFRVTLDNSNPDSICNFLYQLRCGIVHTKEGEVLVDRTSDNENLLGMYVLPYIIKLCTYLIEH